MMVKKIALLFALVLTTFVGVCYAVSPMFLDSFVGRYCDGEDDFTGTTIDTYKWTEVDVDSLITQNDELLFDCTGTTAHTGYLDGVWKIPAGVSATVEVEFNDLTLDAPDSNTNLAPRISFTDGSVWGYVARSRGTTTNGYASWGTSTAWDAYADTDSSGKLRISINRSTGYVTVGVWNGSSWEWNGGAERELSSDSFSGEVTFRIWFAKQVSAGSTTVSVDLDNLIFSDGECSY